MRTWVRATSETICGGPCYRRIREGEAYLEIRMEGLKRVIRRCPSCAHEEPPPDLPRDEPAREDQPA